MGIEISRLSPLIQTQLPVAPMVPAAPEPRDPPLRVVAAAASAGTELQGGATRHEAAGGRTRLHRSAPLDGAQATAAPPTSATSRQGHVDAVADSVMAAQAASGATILHDLPPAVDGAKAARHYAETAEALEEAQSFMDRVSLMPEPGDLALAASEMPPYGPREVERTAFPTAPPGDTVTRS